MVKSTVSLSSQCSLPVEREKRWPYDEYYFGDKDDADRRVGEGENHWTGAESIEWYTGRFLRDTMHGLGDYRWRYKNEEGVFATYEGHFYVNKLHGYGVMSYPNGRVFTGLFYKDLRWGPGVETLPCLRSNVGLWRGTQLARLTWRPASLNIVPDFNTGPQGTAYLEPFRTVLMEKIKTIGKTNSAIELLKKCGAEPKWATENWMKLYAVDCTDLESSMCHKDLFDYAYYKGNIEMLEIDDGSRVEDKDEANPENEEKDVLYFAWNNNEMIIHMMQHCYQHEKQRSLIHLKLPNVLNGPRNKFRSAAKQELDCRMVLMSCFLGNVIDVVQLINEEYIYPDIADIQGNTALMYAVCGNQCELIHFLVEAGGTVNCYNDSCCTPLSIALIRYICFARDIPLNALVRALLPPIVPHQATDQNINQKDNVVEWHIQRNLPPQLADSESLRISVGPSGKSVEAKKIKSAPKLLTQQPTETKRKEPDNNYVSDDDSEERTLFSSMQATYEEKLNQYYQKIPQTECPYLFEINDMIKEIREDDVQFGAAVKPIKKEKSKKDVLKNQVGSVRESLESTLSKKQEMLFNIQLTIIQLLKDGADPTLVRCPQPALVLALKTGSTEIVRHIVTHGANPNEKFKDFLDYTALDLMISEPFSSENLEIIRTLLEVGADATHRLRVPTMSPDVPEQEIPGPTLLHAVLARKTDSTSIDDIRDELIKLLLKYRCDPYAIYNERSAIDIAMMKNIELLEIFINNGIDLNKIINSSNHTILTKLFSKEFYIETIGIDKFPILTNLLLYGADPLIECYDGDRRFRNVFEYAKFVLKFKEGKREKSAAKLNTSKQADTKGGNVKKPEPSKTEWQEYTETLNLMRECARLLHIRWLQATLLKELIDVIWRFKHRSWPMIIKEHKNRHRVGLWVTAPRCLEIWNILKATKKKRYTDDRILNHLLCIVQFYQKRVKIKRFVSPKMTANEMNIIESDVGCLMKEHKIASRLAQEVEACKKFYVKPELVHKSDTKFDVCFECALSLDSEGVIECEFCQLVSFCKFECMENNTSRASCHPCSDMLKQRYFPVALEEELLPSTHMLTD